MYCSAMSMQNDTNTSKQAGAKSALIAACVSGFLFQFDLTALSAALPDIASSLSARVSDQTWIIHVYTLAMIFALPLAGPLADRYGKQRLFIIGTLLFAVASVLCAMATTLLGLLAWRVLQGIAGAAFTASSAAMLAAAYPGHKRSWAFGIMGTVVGISMIAGPPLGALIASLAGWPWVFWINVPVCVVLLVLVWRIPGEQAQMKTQTPLDWAGPAALAVSLGSLAFLMLGGEGFQSLGQMPVLAALFACILALALFVFVEKRHTSPAFDFSLFGSKRFVAMCLVPIAGSMGFWALLVHLPQMARGPMGLDAAATGLLLTALTVPMFLLPALGAKLANRLPAHWYFAGGLTIIGGADLLLALAAIKLDATYATWAVVGSLLIGGIGCALINAQITAAAVSAVPRDRAATASAICVTMRQIGFAFGIALIGALVQRDIALAYTTAFAVVGACTLVVAAITFGLLRRSG